MKITGKFFLVFSQSFIFLFVVGTLYGRDINSFVPKIPGKITSTEFYAVNDTFYFVSNCTSDKLIDNVLKNDVFQDFENIQVCSVFAPKDGLLTFGSNGKFMLMLPDDYSGILEFSYSICSKNNGTESSGAKVVVIVENDNDCDGIINKLDLDNDNDGIPDMDEGDGMLDSDGDRIPDNFDIDSDNDGITDNEEWQKEGNYIIPSETDVNKNGWDDAYDTELDGVYYKPEDTDGNGIPDFIDSDSDGDGSTDNQEAFDMDNDGFADIVQIYIDDDNDGLDDAYDLISCWSLGCNSTGSNSPLPDLNKNGIRDWRDKEIKIGNQSNISAFEIFAYPNPSTGSFFLNTPVFDENIKSELQLFNLQGIEIYREFIVPGISKINVENIASGSYILQINSGANLYQTVICIQ